MMETRSEKVLIWFDPYYLRESAAQIPNPKI